MPPVALPAHIPPVRNLSHADLSFNRIKKIEGLSHLKALKDLTLFNNEITTGESALLPGLPEGGVVSCACRYGLAWAWRGLGWTGVLDKDITGDCR